MDYRTDIFSLACGDCGICPYRGRCSEYDKYGEYAEFIKGKGLEELMNERT